MEHSHDQPIHSCIHSFIPSFLHSGHRLCSKSATRAVSHVKQVHEYQIFSRRAHSAEFEDECKLRIFLHNETKRSHQFSSPLATPPKHLSRDAMLRSRIWGMRFHEYRTSTSGVQLPVLVASLPLLCAAFCLASMPPTQPLIVQFLS